jgi:hypothetical protein
MKRQTFFWIAAILITLFAVVFQRKTGPTYPQKVHFQVDTLNFTVKLPRSHVIDSSLHISIPEFSWEWTARFFHRPYPTNENWMVEPFFPENGKFVTCLPEVKQKAAKIEYFIELSNLAAGKEIRIPEGDPVIIRYKGNVPAWALLPHIILIFIALILSNLAGIMAVFNHQKFKLFGILTLLLILFGGLIFGPIVQKFAFNHYWTGFPFGSDLTDNKTLIMFIVWAIAVSANYKKGFRWLTIIASVVTIVVYCIPHSLRGSEFDYQAGEIVTGMISFLQGYF